MAWRVIRGRVRVLSGERGAVYVEFLLAFVPVFLLFLAICQLALVNTAALVVRHSAYVAARSAIVVLEDDPERYDDAPRGRLSVKRPATGTGTALFTALGIAAGELPELPEPSLPEPTDGGGEGDGDDPPQQGARMVPIRTAAYARLLTLAPKSAAPGEGDTLLSSVSNDFVSELGAALRYTASAAVVTLHRNGAEHLAVEPVPRDVPITARVTYLYTCRVPVVRAVMCRSLASLLPPAGESPEQEETDGVLAARMRLSERPSDLEAILPPGAHLAVLTAEVTLPNQGAAYVGAETP